MLGITLNDRATAILIAANLSALNIDPHKAAEDFRGRVLGQLGSETTEKEKSTVREQLS